MHLDVNVIDQIKDTSRDILDVIDKGKTSTNTKIT